MQIPARAIGGSPDRQTARAEWRSAPMLPFAGLLGHATAVLHINGYAPFIVPISQDFGWSRSLTTLGLTMILLMQAVSSIPMGFLVDRFGSRRIGLIGMISAPLGFALLGSTTGGEANWLMLWFLLGIMAMPVQSTIWTAAISNSFETSRGMALGVSMCGTSLASALFPWLGAILIEKFGWQQALFYQSVLWIAVTFPFMFAFLRVKPGPVSAGTDQATSARVVIAPSSDMTLREGLRSSVFLRMLLVGTAYTFVIPIMVINFVAILTDSGLDPVEAARIAALAGFSSLAARLATGFLVDRTDATRVGAVAFLTPLIGCIILLFYGIDRNTAVIAAILLGIAAGAELDIFGYLTSRYFGVGNFGSLFGCILTSLTIGSGLGHVGASMIFDTTHSYSGFIWLTAIVSGLCCLCFLTLPKAERLKPGARATLAPGSSEGLG